MSLSQSKMSSLSDKIEATVAEQAAPIVEEVEEVSVKAKKVSKPKKK